MDGDIPLWIKIAYTGLLTVIVPVYAMCYGWRNFLWFSDIALIATGIALCSRKGNQLLWSESMRSVAEGDSEV